MSICSDPGLGVAFAAFLEVRIPFNSVCKHVLSTVMSHVVKLFLKVFQPVIDKFLKSINIMAKLVTHVPTKGEFDWSLPARKIVARLLNCPEIHIKKAGDDKVTHSLTHSLTLSLTHARTHAPTH